MKKLFYIGALSVLLLAACGEEEAKPKEDTPVEEANNGAEEKSDSPTQEELNAKLKAEATAIDFVAANGGEIAEKTKVTITGKVTTVMSEGVGGVFTVTTTEGDGVGMYTIENYSMTETAEDKEVTIYGTFAGKDEAGMPKIVATIIE